MSAWGDGQHTLRREHSTLPRRQVARNPSLHGRRVTASQVSPSREIFCEHLLRARDQGTRTWLPTDPGLGDAYMGAPDACGAQSVGAGGSPDA